MKTALFVNLIHSLCKNNDDVIVGLLSIDDSLKEIIPRFICYSTIDRNGINSFVGENFTINHFSTPSLYKNSNYYDLLLSERNISFKEIGNWLSEGKLYLLDSENGRSFDFLSSSIRSIRDKYPNKKIIFFLDNFHLLNTDSWSESGFDRIKKMSHELKALAVNTSSTIISTVELRKLEKGKKADNNDLAGSNSLQYDANAIIHLHSELDIDPFSSRYFKHGAFSKKNPIIEATVSKNKIGGYKGSIYGKLYASQAYYSFMTEEIFSEIYSENEAERFANDFVIEN